MRVSVQLLKESLSADQLTTMSEVSSFNLNNASSSVLGRTNDNDKDFLLLTLL